MCGITGFLDVAGAPVDPAPLAGMVEILHHRGPDESGCWSDGAIALGHARLGIIDLDGGQQPMLSPDESHCIAFNGEIFNYRELGEDLRRQGVDVRATSDTAVLLATYLARGESCVQELNGQWAFAIWDRRRRSLFASRDRLGIRPFYYTRAGDLLLFASEIKSLLRHPRVEARIDAEALDQIFTCWSCVSPRTPFAGIFELPPGHCLRVRDGRVETWPYWQLEFPEEGAGDPDPLPGARAEERARDELEALLIDAARLRLRADVPVGSYLSGGLDSTAIAAVASKEAGAVLETFSVTFEDPTFDESGPQQRAVEHLGTNHHAVHCRAQDVGAVLPRVVWHAETPLVRTAPAPLLLLSGLVRERGFKVVLTGEGADEVFGGYDIFKEAKIRRFWGRVPDSRWRPLLLKRLYPYLQNLQRQSPAYLQSFFRVTADDLRSPYFSHLPRWALTSRIHAFYGEGMRDALGAEGFGDAVAALLPGAYSNWTPLAQAQFLESKLLLPSYLLSSQGDRMTMANSVEGRYPFLDHRVVEFGAALPPQLKLRGLDEKYLLKQAMRARIPVEVGQRAKQPYRAPDAASIFCLEEGTRARPEVEELLTPERLERSGVFDPRAVAKLVAKARRGRAIGFADNQALVAIVTTQLFFEQFIHGLGEMR